MSPDPAQTEHKPRWRRWAVWCWIGWHDYRPFQPERPCCQMCSRPLCRKERCLAGAEV